MESPAAVPGLALMGRAALVAPKVEADGDGDGGL